LQQRSVGNREIVGKSGSRFVVREKEEVIAKVVLRCGDMRRVLRTVPDGRLDGSRSPSAENSVQFKCFDGNGHGGFERRISNKP
jgi:hypothetical protein